MSSVGVRHRAMAKAGGSPPPEDSSGSVELEGRPVVEAVVQEEDGNPGGAIHAGTQTIKGNSKGTAGEELRKLKKGIPKEGTVMVDAATFSAILTELRQTRRLLLRQAKGRQTEGCLAEKGLTKGRLTEGRLTEKRLAKGCLAENGLTKERPATTLVDEAPPPASSPEELDTLTKHPNIRAALAAAAAKPRLRPAVGALLRRLLTPALALRYSLDGASSTPGDCRAPEDGGAPEDRPLRFRRSRAHKLVKEAVLSQEGFASTPPRKINTAIAAALSNASNWRSKG